MSKATVFRFSTTYGKLSGSHKGVKEFIAFFSRKEGPLDTYLKTCKEPHQAICAFSETVHGNDVDAECILSFIKPAFDKDTVVGIDLTISELITASWFSVNHTFIDLIVTKEELTSSCKLFPDSFEVLFF